MRVNWPELTDEDIELKAAKFRQQALEALDAKSDTAVQLSRLLSIIWVMNGVVDD